MTDRPGDRAGQAPLCVLVVDDDEVDRMIVRRALVVPKVRRATKPSRAAKARRLDEKRRQSEKKRQRRPLDE